MLGTRIPRGGGAGLRNRDRRPRELATGGGPKGVAPVVVLQVEPTFQSASCISPAMACQQAGIRSGRRQEGGLRDGGSRTGMRVLWGVFIISKTRSFRERMRNLQSIALFFDALPKITSDAEGVFAKLQVKGIGDNPSRSQP